MVLQRKVAAQLRPGLPRSQWAAVLTSVQLLIRRNIGARIGGSNNALPGASAGANGGVAMVAPGTASTAQRASTNGVAIGTTQRQYFQRGTQSAPARQSIPDLSKVPLSAPEPASVLRRRVPSDRDWGQRSYSAQSTAVAATRPLGAASFAGGNNADASGTSSVAIGGDSSPWQLGGAPAAGISAVAIGGRSDGRRCCYREREWSRCNWRRRVVSVPLARKRRLALTTV